MKNSSKGDSVSETYRRIWAVVKRIPRGKVATYGQLAALAGFPRQPRLAGYAMHHAPDSAQIPWHRVVNARGEVSMRSGGYVGVAMQRALLEAEGIHFGEDGRIDLARYFWKSRATKTAALDVIRRRRVSG